MKKKWIKLSGKNKGFSLPSLMVGMLVSLVVILSAMTLYRHSVMSSASSTLASTRSGSAESALLSSLGKMQQAGFGITYVNSATITSNLVVLNNASITGTTLSGTAKTVPTGTGTAVSGNAIIFGWQNPTTSAYSCMGYVFQNNQYIALTASSCSSAANWSSVSWTQMQMVGAGMSNTSNFTVSYTACSPFGFTTTTSAPVVTLNMIYNDTYTKSINGTVCMLNL